MLLDIRDLKTHFFMRRGIVKAVDGVTFGIEKGQTLGIVGETGSGKSVTALSIMRLIQYPGRITAGKILFENEDLLRKSESEMRDIRGRRISMIFQDPSAALNPVYSIGDQLFESIRVHTKIRPAEAKETAVKMLELVGIPSPEQRLNNYPHELSGGMKQRVMIALALSCNPSLLIADEPTTALDVTIQAQVLRLLKDLVKRVGSSMMLITHNLGIVAETCDRVCIMYAGRIVEEAGTLELFEKPMHPYTRGLLTAFPKLGERKEELSVIRGTVPNLMNPFPGCSFVDRCDFATDQCRRVRPKMAEVAPGHLVACHLYQGGGEKDDA